jgi:SAM-dependent methyltransferase
MKTTQDIERFWDAHPCGESLVGKDTDLATFYRKYDEYRYRTEGHILRELDRLSLKGRDLLEIGIGQAADSEQLIRRGARWHGLDLTAEAVFRARRRFELFQLPYQAITQGSAGEIPYPENMFDIVYSHGVLHHIPDIRAVSAEIRRVLKPGGKLIIMLYHARSLNYWISINLIRRFLMVGLYAVGKLGGKTWLTNPLLLGHLENADQHGLFRYLSNPLFMMKNTDGPGNPYSKVYDRTIVQEDLKEFQIEESRVHFLNDRHLPFLRILPPSLKRRLEGKLGWHLWVVLT